MPTLAARLTNTGDLLTASGVELDEITQTNISIQQSAFYASEFDELTNITGFVAATKRGTSVTSATNTLYTPTGTIQGDLMIMILVSASVTATFTTPSGWTRMTAGGTSPNGRAAFYMIAGSTIPDSVTVTQSGESNHQYGYILTYRNASFDSTGLADAAASGTVTPTAITVAADNSILLYVVTTNTVTGVTYSTPTGFTPLINDQDGTLPSSAIFYATSNAGTSVNPTTTPSGTQGRAFLISIGLGTAKPPARFLSTGKVLLSTGVFDEVTGIS